MVSMLGRSGTINKTQFVKGTVFGWPGGNWQVQLLKIIQIGLCKVEDLVNPIKQSYEFM
jgi:hypothetical protein